MLQQQTTKREVFTFKHFAHKPYALFNALGREVRIGRLAICMLASVPSISFATSSDSIRNTPHLMEDEKLEEVIVSSSRVPVTFEESATKATLIGRQEIQRAKAQSVNDLLKLCAGVDVRQRGAFGVQTDVGIGGGTFDQTSIFINGISVNNPQTGHLAADFPVAIQDIERIEIYDGATARAFGSQALNGAINIITKSSQLNQAGAHAEAGSYGSAGIGGFINQANARTSNRFSAGYQRSDGGTRNSDFQKLRGFYQGAYETDELQLDWQAGYNYMRYGANTFYSSKYPDQFERDNRILASFKGLTRTGSIRLQPTLSWVRSYDHFQLIRSTHTAENFHRNDVLTSGLNAFTKWALGRTAFGGEVRYEGILSTNLGQPLDSTQYVGVEGHPEISYNHKATRTNINFFLEHVAVIQRFSLSAGILANRNSAVDEGFSFYPGIDLSFRPADGIKIFASWNKSMRLPTFTDLFYKSPTTQGNIGLRPEKNSTFKLGGSYAKGCLSASVQGIFRHGTDMIDWVMYSADDIYHSTQFKLDNYELVSQANLDFSRIPGCERCLLQSFSASYTYNYQKRRDDVEIFKSNYALEYLRHKLTLALSHNIWRDLSASWYLNWQKRMGGYLIPDAQGNSVLHSYDPYAVLSLKLAWTRPKYDVYGSFENLTAHRYYDFGSIPQPRLWMMFGANYRFNL